MLIFNKEILSYNKLYAPINNIKYTIFNLENVEIASVKGCNSTFFTVNYQGEVYEVISKRFLFFFGSGFEIF